MSSYYISSDLSRFYYISHHGILGQRWGIRRFQNKDGSLTAEGRKRYNSNVVKAAKNYADLDNRASADIKKAQSQLKSVLRDANDNSKELRLLLDNAKSLEKYEQEEWEKWINDDERVHQTMKEVLNEKSPEKIKELREYYNDTIKRYGSDISDKYGYSLDPNPKSGKVDNWLIDTALKLDGGSDMYTNLWQHEVNNSERLSSSRNERWDIGQKYYKKSKEYFNGLLGSEGKVKLKNGYPYDKSVSEFLARMALDNYNDYVTGFEPDSNKSNKRKK